MLGKMTKLVHNIDYSNQNSLNYFYSEGSSYRGNQEHLIPWGGSSIEVLCSGVQIGLGNHSLESSEA